MGLLGGIFLFMLGSTLIPQFLGPSFTMARPLIHCLSFGLIVYYPNFLLTIALVLLGKPMANMWIAAVAAAVNIGGNVWAIPRYGSMGAAVMTVSTESVIFVLSVGTILYLQKSSALQQPGV